MTQDSGKSIGLLNPPTKLLIFNEISPINLLGQPNSESRHERQQYNGD